MIRKTMSSRAAMLVKMCVAAVAAILLSVVTAMDSDVGAGTVEAEPASAENKQVRRPSLKLMVPTPTLKNPLGVGDKNGSPALRINLGIIHASTGDGPASGGSSSNSASSGGTVAATAEPQQGQLVTPHEKSSPTYSPSPLEMNLDEMQSPVPHVPLRLKMPASPEVKPFDYQNYGSEPSPAIEGDEEAAARRKAAWAEHCKQNYARWQPIGLPDEKSVERGGLERHGAFSQVITFEDVTDRQHLPVSLTAQQARFIVDQTSVRMEDETDKYSSPYFLFRGYEVLVREDAPAPLAYPEISVGDRVFVLTQNRWGNVLSVPNNAYGYYKVAPPNELTTDSDTDGASDDFEEGECVDIDFDREVWTDLKRKDLRQPMRQVLNAELQPIVTFEELKGALEAVAASADANPAAGAGVGMLNLRGIGRRQVMKVFRRHRYDDQHAENFANWQREMRFAADLKSEPRYFTEIVSWYPGQWYLRKVAQEPQSNSLESTFGMEISQGFIETYKDQFVHEYVGLDAKIRENRLFSGRVLRRESIFEFPIIVMEEAIYGDLFEFTQDQVLANKHSPPFMHNTGVFGGNFQSTQFALGVLKEILECTSRLEAKGIIHKDIKIENFLVIGFYPDGVPMLQLTDFGLAVRQTDSSAYVFESKALGFTLSPEMEREAGSVTSAEFGGPEGREMRDSARIHASGIDVWAVASSVLILTFGYYPWEAVSRSLCENSLFHRRQRPQKVQDSLTSRMFAGVRLFAADDASSFFNVKEVVTGGSERYDTLVDKLLVHGKRSWHEHEMKGMGSWPQGAEDPLTQLFVLLLKKMFTWDISKRAKSTFLLAVLQQFPAHHQELRSEVGNSVSDEAASKAHGKMSRFYLEALARNFEAIQGGSEIVWTDFKEDISDIAKVGTWFHQPFRGYVRVQEFAPAPLENFRGWRVLNVDGSDSPAWGIPKRPVLQVGLRVKIADQFSVLHNEYGTLTNVEEIQPHKYFSTATCSFHQILSDSNQILMQMFQIIF